MQRILLALLLSLATVTSQIAFAWDLRECGRTKDFFAENDLRKGYAQAEIARLTGLIKQEQTDQARIYEPRLNDAKKAKDQLAKADSLAKRGVEILEKTAPLITTQLEQDANLKEFNARLSAHLSIKSRNIKLSSAFESILLLEQNYIPQITQQSLKDLLQFIRYSEDSDLNWAIQEKRILSEITRLNRPALEAILSGIYHLVQETQDWLDVSTKNSEMWTLQQEELEHEWRNSSLHIQYYQSLINAEQAKLAEAIQNDQRIADAERSCMNRGGGRAHLGVL